MEKKDIPLGFGFALMRNPDAMRVFSALSDERRAEIIHRAHEVSSKSEMRALVDEMAKTDGG